MNGSYLPAKVLTSGNSKGPSGDSEVQPGWGTSASPVKREGEGEIVLKGSDTRWLRTGPLWLGREWWATGNRMKHSAI